MMVIVAAVLTIVCVLTMMYLTLMERKLVGRIQDRIGPNRVGPYGLLQPIADAIKMLTKEDITPRAAHRIIYNLAPVVIIPTAFLTFAFVPFGRGMVAADLNVAFLFILGFSSASTISILMAGWSSHNKYSLLGAMRGVAQMVSYEIPLILSALSVILIASSLSLNDIVLAQGGYWFILGQPLAFIIFLISGTAELNRSPFDLPEAESEILAGYHTEYSGLKFGVFYIAEYVATFAMSATATTLFLGGWQGPLLPSWFWFFAKTLIMIFIFMWMRGTLPRLRVDQLMSLAWKFMVPLALANLLMTAILLPLVHENPYLELIALIGGTLVVAAGAIFVATRYARRPGTSSALVPGEGVVAGQ
ncbi:MAG: NADH-quinone oxidoreductase subunit NuoH [Chloroflexi bacterium]|nr:NADH-quinone oxidoreductase subunit NuoH [Chloroflexota bacterium]